jgi:hypothetical protein
MFGRVRSKQKAQLEKALSLTVKRRARAISELIHQNQKDKAGEPYTEHPKRVAQNTYLLATVSGNKYNKEDRRVASEAAWLHDVIEDSGSNGYPKVSIQDLQNWGIDEKVTEVIYLLTKKANPGDDPSKDPYYLAIKSNKIARLVKIADLTDNLNQERLLKLKSGSFTKKEYYEKAIAFLELDESEKAFFRFRIESPTRIENIQRFESKAQKAIQPNRDDWFMDSNWIYKSNSLDWFKEGSETTPSFMKDFMEALESASRSIEENKRLVDDFRENFMYSIVAKSDQSPNWIHILRQMLRAGKTFEDVWQSTIIEVADLPRAQEIWITWLTQLNR